MDPLGGGTRAARYIALGQWGLAWRYNPLAILVVLAGVVITLRALVGVLTHRWLTMSASWSPRRFRIGVLIVLSLLIILEVRQQTRADLLMAGT